MTNATIKAFKMEWNLQIKLHITKTKLYISQAFLTNILPTNTEHNEPNKKTRDHLTNHETKGVLVIPKIFINLPKLNDKLY